MGIILASQSARRKYLLRRMGLTFSVIPSDFEEYFDQNLSVSDLTKELAIGKASSVAIGHPEEVVVGSDVLISIDNKQIGKPKDIEDAVSILKSLSGKEHQVISAVAVVCKSKNFIKVGSGLTIIRFKKLDDEFIMKYVATGTTLDKGGGYAIQHSLLTPYIDNISGRIDNIIGLPTNILRDLLGELDIESKQVELKYTDLLKVDELQ